MAAASRQRDITAFMATGEGFRAIRRAICDPGAVVKRLRHRNLDRDEDMADWQTRAVMTTLGRTSAPDNPPQVIGGPWVRLEDVLSLIRGDAEADSADPEEYVAGMRYAAKLVEHEHREGRLEDSGGWKHRPPHFHGRSICFCEHGGSRPNA